MKNIIKQYLNKEIILLDTANSPIGGIDDYLLYGVTDEYFVINEYGTLIIYPFTSIFRIEDDGIKLVIYLNSEIQL